MGSSGPFESRGLVLLTNRAVGDSATFEDGGNDDDDDDNESFTGAASPQPLGSLASPFAPPGPAAAWAGAVELPLLDATASTGCVRSAPPAPLPVAWLSMLVRVHLSPFGATVRALDPATLREAAACAAAADLESSLDWPKGLCAARPPLDSSGSAETAFARLLAAAHLETTTGGLALVLDLGGTVYIRATA